MSYMNVKPLSNLYPNVRPVRRFVYLGNSFGKGGTRHKLIKPGVHLLTH